MDQARDSLPVKSNKQDIARADSTLRGDGTFVRRPLSDILRVHTQSWTVSVFARRLEWDAKVPGKRIR